MITRIGEHLCLWSCPDFWLAVVAGAMLLALGALFLFPRGRT